MSTSAPIPLSEIQSTEPFHRLKDNDFQLNHITTQMNDFSSRNPDFGAQLDAELKQPYQRYEIPLLQIARVAGLYLIVSVAAWSTSAFTAWVVWNNWNDGQLGFTEKNTDNNYWLNYYLMLPRAISSVFLGVGISVAAKGFFARKSVAKHLELDVPNLHSDDMSIKQLAFSITASFTAVVLTAVYIYLAAAVSPTVEVTLGVLYATLAVAACIPKKTDEFTPEPIRPRM